MRRQNASLLPIKPNKLVPRAFSVFQNGGRGQGCQNTSKNRGTPQNTPEHPGTGTPEHPGTPRNTAGSPSKPDRNTREPLKFVNS